MPVYKPTTFYFRPLLKTMLEKITDTPLTIVEAPMGYGKTTAVREYVKSIGAYTLWETLDSGSVEGFWQGLAHLIGRVDPDCGQKLGQLGFPGTLLFMDEALAIMESVTFPKKTILVIDDYHLLLSEDVDHFIELLVKTEIANLHIVIISRVSFGEQATELVLKGYCTLINRRCLELSQAETVEYYKKCGVRLNPQEANLLQAYTEGWISALYLCLLSYLQDGRIERQESLNDLIGKVVYKNFPQNVKDFLLTLCIFDKFTFEQAKMMWRGNDAEAILHRLTKRNAFISWDHSTQTYQAHNIFTFYLREIFAGKARSEQQTVWQRAGQWYVHAGDYLRAMDCFYEAADLDSLLSALEQEKGLRLTSESMEKLTGFFRDCPPEIKQAHPRACLIYAMYLFSFNEMDLFSEECQYLAGLVETLRPDNGMPTEQLAGELELLCSFSAYNNITAMSGHQRKAYELLKSPSKFYDRNTPWTFESPSVLYLFYRESGKLTEEMRELAEGIPYYYQITADHGAGGEYVMQAERHYYRGEFEQAGIVSHTALYAARAANQPAMAVCALFVLLRLALAQGNAAALTDGLQQIREEVEKSGIPPCLRMLGLCEGFIYNGLCQLKKVPAWIADGNLHKSQLPFPTHAYFNIIYGKTLLGRGEYLKLLGIAAHFKEIATVFPNLLAQIYTCIYEAAAHHKLQHRQEAQVALKQALCLAAPDQLLMPFVENGGDIGTVLGELTSGAEYGEFIGRVRAVILTVGPAMAHVQKTLAGADAVAAAMTAREREIAELAVSGLSNALIGKQLYVTEVTIKKALQSIYAKLGINNRTALAKAMLDLKSY
jgi:LuxR family maltose regulon positive regulatory protein